MLLKSGIEKNGEKKVNRDEEIKNEGRRDLGENVTSRLHLVSLFFLSSFWSMNRPIMLCKVCNAKKTTILGNDIFYNLIHTLLH